MNMNQKAWIVFATLMAVALLVAFLGINYLEPPARPFAYRLGYRPPLADIELYYTVRIVLSTINATLLIFLFSTYLGMYRKMKSDFTLGLMVFSTILLLYALSSNPLVQWAFGFRAFGLGPFAMLPDMFTCVALIVLLYLTFR
jgi:hypothetical protein